MFVSDKCQVQFESLCFNTPSGLIEIDSEDFVKAGLGHAPDWHGFTLPQDGKFRLLSPSHAFLVNSTYGNDPRLFKHIGPPTILINAVDAAKGGFEAGEQVEVRRGDSALTLSVEISEVPAPGVAICYKSRWPTRDASQSNVNVLNPGLRADLGEGTAVNSLEVTISHILRCADTGGIVK